MSPEYRQPPVPDDLVLVQYDVLPITRAITSPEKISPLLCQKIFNLCQQICEKNNFCGLALNEIPETILNQWGIPLELRRTIFLRPNLIKPDAGTVRQDTLLFNPNITPSYKCNRPRPPASLSTVAAEACGSLPKGIGAFISRPLKCYVDAYTWASDSTRHSPRHTKLKKGYPWGDALQHEVDHLKGVSLPHRFRHILNPFNNTDWAEIYGEYRIQKKIFLKNLAAQWPQGILVNVQDELRVYDFSGNNYHLFEWQPRKKQS